MEARSFCAVDRCFYYVLEWNLYVCFSSFQSLDSRLSKDRSRRRESHPRLPQVANHALVRETGATPSRRPHSASARLPVVTTGTHQETPSQGQTPHARLRGVGEAFSRQGLTSPVIDFLIESWRTGTQRQYDVYITRWVTFCNNRTINMFDPDVDLVLQFLLECFNTGLAYSTLNTIRSALSTLILMDGVPVGQHPLVSRFMRAVFNKRPTKPKITAIWDVNKVLDYLAKIGPAKTIPIALLTKKLVALMAVLSGVRGQNLFLLNALNMTLDCDFVTFQINGLTKTARPGRPIPDLHFVAYPQNRRLCVVYYLRVYLQRTLHVRWTPSLFMTYGNNVGHAASRDTVRRWIRDVLVEAGIDMGIFTPHSTRSASTSAAATCVSLSTILRTAGWYSSSTFQRHYKKPILKTCAFQEGLLKRHRKR